MCVCACARLCVFVVCCLVGRNAYFHITRGGNLAVVMAQPLFFFIPSKYDGYDNGTLIVCVCMRACVCVCVFMCVCMCIV